MTDRVLGFAVVLDKNMRDDDVRVIDIIKAIEMIKYVSAVKPITADAPREDLIKMRVETAVMNTLFDLARDFSIEKYVNTKDW